MSQTEIKTSMLTTKEIQFATDKGKFMNVRIFEYLSKMVALVSETLPGFMQEQLDAFNRKKADLSKTYDELADNPAVPYKVSRVREVESLIAEEKFNQKLMRFVRLYRVYLNVNHERGLPVPDCPTSWIYQDFSELRDRTKAETRSATCLCDLLFDKYVLRKDQSVARIVWAAEQEVKWHKTVPLKRNYPPPPDYQPISEQYFCPPSRHLDQSTSGEQGANDADLSDGLDPDCRNPQEPEIPEILRKEFGNRVPTTEELREAVTSYIHNAYSGKNRATVKAEDVLAYTNQLVEAKMTVLRRKREALYVNRQPTEQTYSQDHMTPVCRESELKSKPVKRRYEGISRAENLDVKQEAQTVRVFESAVKTCVKASDAQSVSATRSHVIKKEHVPGDVLPVNEGIPACPGANKVRMIEQSCYSDRIY